LFEYSSIGKSQRHAMNYRSISRVVLTVRTYPVPTYKHTYTTRTSTDSAESHTHSAYLVGI